MRKLSLACKGLQDSLLEFASHKPVKSIAKKGKQTEIKMFQEGNFKTLIEKILEFKYIHTINNTKQPVLMVKKYK